MAAPGSKIPKKYNNFDDGNHRLFLCSGLPESKTFFANNAVALVYLLP